MFAMPANTHTMGTMQGASALPYHGGHMAHTSFVTHRVLSNIRTHGLRFAVDTEVARFQRAGRSREAAISCGLAQVSSILKLMRT